MQSAAPIFKLVSIVPAADDVQQSARWPSIRIVINREKISRRIKRHRERVPKACRKPFDLCAVAPAAKNISTLAVAAHRRTIFALQRIRQTEILAKTNIKPAIRP